MFVEIYNKYQNSAVQHKIQRAMETNKNAQYTLFRKSNTFVFPCFDCMQWTVEGSVFGALSL